MSNSYEEIFKKYGFSKSQLEILNIVGKNKKILEVGSSTGYMTKVFKHNRCMVDVVEIDKDALDKVKKIAKKTYTGSIEELKILNAIKRDYDFIIMADVLEHLINPEKVLKILSKITDLKTKLIISMPNIACWPMRKDLFFKGKFEYSETGLLDKTHLHFYTVTSFPKLLNQNGWRVDDLKGTILIFPFQKKLSMIPIFGSFIISLIEEKIALYFKNLLFYHFVITASKK